MSRSLRQSRCRYVDFQGAAAGYKVHVSPGANSVVSLLVTGGRRPGKTEDTKQQTRGSSDPRAAGCSLCLCTDRSDRLQSVGRGAIVKALRHWYQLRVVCQQSNPVSRFILRSSKEVAFGKLLITARFLVSAPHRRTRAVCRSLKHFVAAVLGSLASSASSLKPNGISHVTPRTVNLVSLLHSLAMYVCLLLLLLLMLAAACCCLRLCS